MVFMTVKNLIYSLLKTSFSIFLVCFPLLVSGQFKIIDSVAVTNITDMSADRQGNIYLGDKNGNIQKYSGKLEKLEVYSPERKGSIAVLDCWNPLRLFVSYADLQEFLFLDRFMVNANRFDLKKLTPYAGIKAPSVDNNLWFIDYSDFSLKKYNITYDDIIISRPFDLLLNRKDYELSHLREYQNLVFLSDIKSGILVFDNLGNYLYKIEDKGIDSFNFLNDEIYYLVNGNIIKRHLYTGEIMKEKIHLPVEQIIITNNNYFFLTKKWLFSAVKQ